MPLIGNPLVQRWYVQVDDLIGGWCVTNVNKPPSQLNWEIGEYEVASFVLEDVARHIAHLHNQSLGLT